MLKKVDIKLLATKKVLILGLGKEGESTLKFFTKYFPNKPLGLADKLPFNSLSPSLKKLIKKRKKDQLFLGKDYLKALKQYQIVIKTPGIPLSLIKPYLNKSQIVTSQTDIFLEKYRNCTIGITGTKGKSTTASLIYQILKSAKLKTHLIGNIGKPALTYYSLKPSFNKLFVYEMSSHQLNELKISPHIAVFLNFYQEHLDYYSNIEEYFQAKANITKWQQKGDYFIFNADSSKIKKLASQTKATIIPFGIKNKSKRGCFIRNDWIYYQKEKIIHTSKIPLIGEYYFYNVMAAICVSRILNISIPIIRKAISNFQPLKHRLEYVGEYKGIKFYNDSLATIPEATIFAIKTLKNVDTLIAGGYDRGQQFQDLVKTIVRYKIPTVILFPPSGYRLKQLLEKQPRPPQRIIVVNNMYQAVKKAFQYTKKRKICLLSPASASFGLFKDYKERGNLFKKYVKILGKK